MCVHIWREIDMLKVGVVGMRGIGNQHADCYVSSPHAEVVAVCDKVQELADQAAARLNLAVVAAIQGDTAGALVAAIQAKIQS